MRMTHRHKEGRKTDGRLSPLCVVVAIADVFGELYKGLPDEVALQVVMMQQMPEMMTTFLFLDFCLETRTF